MKKRPWLRRCAIGLFVGACAIIAFLWWLLPGTHSVGEDRVLPVRFVEGLVYAEPETVTGVRLKLLVDTGGGLFLTAQCAQRCGLSPVTLPGGRRARLPALGSEWIPEPTGGEKWMPIVDLPGDGMLGQRWFAGGVWTIDYPAQKLILHHTPFTPSTEMEKHVAPLGFRREYGLRTSNHPRLQVTISGNPVEALLDTGATVWLSAGARRIAGDNRPSERATSFVSADLFGRWQESHPDWRVIEKGCEKSGESMIEVPELEVAGLSAGPVWFTRRGNTNYEWMSSFMDRPILASIGGNFLEHFRITLDYPAARAYFVKHP